MSYYQKHILPWLLNVVMRQDCHEKERADVVKQAFGVVAEIGFGSGLNLPFYKNVSKLYAIEPSDQLYKLASEQIKLAIFPIEHIKNSAEKIPLQDNSVDTVISTWTLCSIPDPIAALKEIYRILKHNGKFIFIEHGLSPSHTIAWWQRFLTPFSKRLAGGCHLNREIDKLILEAGFKIHDLKKFQQDSMPLNYLYKGVGVKD